MHLIDTLRDDFVANDLLGYNLAVSIFMTVGTSKMGVIQPFVSATDLSRMSPEEQIRAAMRAGAGRQILTRICELGECLSSSKGQLIGSVDGQFFISSARPLLDTVEPVDNVVLKALDYLPLIQHPTAALSEQGKRRSVETDIQSLGENRAQFVDVYSGAEMAFLLAHVCDKRSFESMASALGHFNRLLSNGLIKDCKVRSCQAGTVRWSISCKVSYSDDWRSVVTPFCVSLQMARLMVMSCCFIEPGVPQRKSHIPLAKIYDRERFQGIYRKAKKFLVGNYTIDLEARKIVKVDAAPSGASLPVDLGGVVAYSLLHTVGMCDPMQHLSIFFSNQLSSLDFSTMIGATSDNSLDSLRAIDPSMALLVLSSTRHEFQDRRFAMGMTDLNKAACLGISSSLYNRGDVEKNKTSTRTVRSTINLLELIGDIVNLCGGFEKVGGKMLHIIWYSAIDMNPVIAFCTLLRVDFIIQVGGSDIFFFRGNRSESHRTYDKAEGVMEGLMPDDPNFFSHQAAVASSYTTSQVPITVCGGLSGSGMEKGVSAAFAMSMFCGLLRHLSEGDRAVPEYVFCDFVLPDACPHFSTTISEICEGRFPREEGSGCTQCEKFREVDSAFGLLKNEPCIALVKPRAAYAHNRHLGLVFCPSFDYETSESITINTMVGVIVADVWRCAKDDSSQIKVPKRLQRGGGVVDDPNGTCELNKLLAVRSARDEVYALKGSERTGPFRKTMLSTCSIRSGSTGSGKYESADVMQVPSDMEYDSD